jgi:hypothetical protein
MGRREQLLQDYGSLTGPEKDEVFIAMILMLEAERDQAREAWALLRTDIDPPGMDAVVDRLCAAGMRPLRARGMAQEILALRRDRDYWRERAMGGTGELAARRTEDDERIEP